MFGGQGFNLGDIFATIKVKTDDLKRGIGEIEKMTDKAQQSGHRLEGFSNGIKKAAKVAAVAITAVAAGAVAFGTSAVKSFMDSQNALAQLNAVLKSTKGAAGVSAKALEDQASALQKVTTFSDEAIMSAQSMLLTFTNVRKEMFTRAIPTILDMSQALGQDLKSSAIQLGKALNDPIRGVTALRRVGVSFTEEQQKQIATMVEAGDVTKAQALILRELQVEFGGSAKAAGDTFAGKMAILKNQIDDVKESIGEIIVNALGPLAARLSTFIASDQFQQWLAKLNEWIATNLPKAIDYLVNVVWPTLKAIFDATWPVIKTIAGAFLDLFGVLSRNTWIIEEAIKLWIALKVAIIMQGVVGTFTATMAAIRAQLLLTNTSVKGTTALVGGLKSLLSKPFVLTILVAAALLSLQKVYEAMKSILGAWDAINNADVAATSAGVSQDAAIRKIMASKRLTNAQKADIIRRTFGNIPGRATGGPVRANMPYVVGESGSELFIPKSDGDIVPGDQVPGGTAVTIHGDVNIDSEQDADYFFNRLDRNLNLGRMGVTPQ